MKFIFLIIVMLTQLAFQMGSIWSANPSYTQEDTSKVISTEKDEAEIPSKRIKIDKKKNEK